MIHANVTFTSEFQHKNPKRPKNYCVLHGISCYDYVRDCCDFCRRYPTPRPSYEKVGSNVVTKYTEQEIDELEEELQIERQLNRELRDVIEEVSNMLSVYL